MSVISDLSRGKGRVQIVGDPIWRHLLLCEFGQEAVSPISGNAGRRFWFGEIGGTDYVSIARIGYAASGAGDLVEEQRTTETGSPTRRMVGAVATRAMFLECTQGARLTVYRGRLPGDFYSRRQPCGMLTAERLKVWSLPAIGELSRPLRKLHVEAAARWMAMGGSGRTGRRWGAIGGQPCTNRLSARNPPGRVV